jgi:hypothetical protein
MFASSSKGKGIEGELVWEAAITPLLGGITVKDEKL